MFILPVLLRPEETTTFGLPAKRCNTACVVVSATRHGPDFSPNLDRVSLNPSRCFISSWRISSKRSPTALSPRRKLALQSRDTWIRSRRTATRCVFEVVDIAAHDFCQGSFLRKMLQQFFLRRITCLTRTFREKHMFRVRKGFALYSG